MNDQKLKVLFLPAWYPSELNAVAGAFVKQHAIALTSSVQLAVYHICPHPASSRLFYYRRTNEDGILTFRMYYREYRSRPFKLINPLIYFLAGLTGYFKTLQQFGRPDINHVHVLTRAGVFALLSKLVHKVPYVISEHWSRYLPERNTYYGFFRKMITRLLVKQSHGLSAVSANLREAMKMHSLDHRTFRLIPNTVDVEFFKPAIRSSCDTNAVFTFLHVSGLSDEVKNITGILTACSMLKERGVCFELRLVGDCRKKQNLISLKDQLNLTSEVKFLGELTGSDLVEQYQQADAFVLFSYFENQPCVLLESFSTGLPVIATEAGGIPEIVTADNGLLTPSGNIELLAEKMQLFVQRRLLFDAEDIRRNAAERFGYSAVAGRILDFYRSK